MHRRLLILTRDTRLPLLLTVLSGLVAGLLTIWQAWLLSSVINAVFFEKQALAQVMRPLFFILAAISKELQHHIKTIVGISTRVTVLGFESIPRTLTGKARRLIDERPKQN